MVDRPIKAWNQRKVRNGKRSENKEVDEKDPRNTSTN